MCGLVAIAAWPAALGVYRSSDRISLIQALVGAVPVGLLFGIGAILLARRARTRIQRTVGRSGGWRAAATGRALGVLGVCAAITGALALGFFELLELFAR